MFASLVKETATPPSPERERERRGGEKSSAIAEFLHPTETRHDIFVVSQNAQQQTAPYDDIKYSRTPPRDRTRPDRTNRIAKTLSTEVVSIQTHEESSLVGIAKKEVCSQNGCDKCPLDEDATIHLSLSDKFQSRQHDEMLSQPHATLRGIPPTNYTAHQKREGGL